MISRTQPCQFSPLPLTPQVHHTLYTPNPADAIVASHIESLLHLQLLHLGAPPSLSKPQLWEGAVARLSGLGQALTPVAALACVMSTWDCLLGVLGVLNRHAQADDYMPVMAWVIIQSRPLRLVSQLHFICNYAIEQGDPHEMWMAHFSAACDMICHLSPHMSIDSELATQKEESVWVAPTTEQASTSMHSPVRCLAPPQAARPFKH